MYIEMKVSGITVDPTTNVPIVILKDLAEKNVLPVWIGVLEAGAIASEMEKIHYSRPMTHDLMRDIVRGMSGTVKKIEVTDLRDNVYYALVHLSSPQGDITIDARPSDAIALALRTGASIFVESSVLGKSSSVEMKKDNAGGDLLDEIPNSEFGKYKM